MTYQKARKMIQLKFLVCSMRWLPTEHFVMLLNRYANFGVWTVISFLFSVFSCCNDLFMKLSARLDTSFGLSVQVKLCLYSFGIYILIIQTKREPLATLVSWWTVYFRR